MMVGSADCPRLPYPMKSLNATIEKGPMGYKMSRIPSKNPKSHLPNDLSKVFLKLQLYKAKDSDLRKLGTLNAEYDLGAR